jgi:ATP-binding protein involved in chromosome partitioning
LVQSIREAGDNGRPAALQKNTPLSDVFEKLTKGVIKELENRNTILPPTEVIKMSNSVGCLTTKN